MKISCFRGDFLGKYLYLWVEMVLIRLFSGNIIIWCDILCGLLVDAGRLEVRWLMLEVGSSLVQRFKIVLL